MFTCIICQHRQFLAFRKDSSVKFPENKERTLENFVKFVETHKSNHVKIHGNYAKSHVRIRNLQRNLDYLKTQNRKLIRRINRETFAKKIAEKRQLIAERQVRVILSEKGAANFDYKSQLQKLSAQNSELLRRVLNAKNQLSKCRRVAQTTVEQLRKRNWELYSTIIRLKANLVHSTESSDSSKVET